MTQIWTLDEFIEKILDLNLQRYFSEFHKYLTKSCFTAELTKSMAIVDDTNNQIAI